MFERPRFEQLDRAPRALSQAAHQALPQAPHQAMHQAMLRCLFLLCGAALLPAQTGEIQTMLQNSEAAWNRGDLAAFASDYEDSPETTFVGKEVVRGGTQAILGRYRRAYPTREAMGTLTFSEIEVRPLGEGFALALGRFSLKRAAEAGGDASGRFTLVLHKTKSGWKIIHDHTS